MSPLHSNSRVVDGPNRANLLGLSALDVGFSYFRLAVPRKLHNNVSISVFLSHTSLSERYHDPSLDDIRHQSTHIIGFQF